MRAGSKKATYGELIGGRYFNVQLDWNKEIGNALYAPGKAQPKKPKDHKIVGKPLPRDDIAPIVYAQTDFCHRRRAAGHAACAHDPPAGRRRDAGEGRRELDQGHPRRPGLPGKGLPGGACRQGMGRHQAPRTSSRWSGRTRSRRSSTRRRFTITSARRLRASTRKAKPDGDVEEAFKNAARVIEAEYEWPFQSHACMGPACAVVEIKDGEATCWTGSQKPHFVQNGIAAHHRQCRSTRCARSGWSGPAPTAAAMPTTRRWTPRCSRRRPAGRCACNTRAIRAPAGIRKARPRSTARARRSTPTATSSPTTSSARDSRASTWTPTAASRTTRWRDISATWQLRSGDNFGIPAEGYVFANKRLSWETIPPFLDRGSPLRTSHLRDPVGPQVHFASESFMDEVAAALNVDPIEFRLRHLKSAARHRRHQGGGGEGRLEAAAVAATRPDRQQRERPRHGLFPRATARWSRSWPKSTSTAPPARSGRASSRSPHDCGLIINPVGLKHTIEGNIVQGISRTLVGGGQVRPQGVTSVDWVTYPILDISETPERIDVVLINHPERAADGRRRRLDPRRWRRRSPTPSSTPPACASAACRSRPTG